TLIDQKENDRTLSSNSRQLTDSWTDSPFAVQIERRGVGTWRFCVRARVEVSSRAAGFRVRIVAHVGRKRVEQRIVERLIAS
ncbi:hypothetical protein K0M31_007479, partial [Melipona bicolor]